MKNGQTLDDSLAPGFLIASPRLDGSPFERALIVIVHHDDEGAMGFIVNKPLSIDLGSLLQSADEALTGEITSSCYDTHVHFGGPVQVEQLWLIYNDPTQARPPRIPGLGKQGLSTQGRLQFDENWCLIADSDSIEDFIYGHRLQPYRPYIGYTGWGPGQLEDEIEEGSWLVLDFEEDLVFGERPPDEAWSGALSRLGVNPMAFMMMGKVGSA